MSGLSAAQKKSRDLKHEKVIRDLLRQAENRQCFDCTTKTVPQYVCTTLNTFVCTTCSGVHREFGHRVKSISYTSFLPEEVDALKQNGNAAAKRKYLANWDASKLAKPAEGNLRAVKSFIEAVFVDQKFAHAVEAEVQQEARPSPRPAVLPAPALSTSSPDPFAGGRVPQAGAGQAGHWVAFGEDPFAPSAAVEATAVGAQAASWEAFSTASPSSARATTSPGLVEGLSPPTQAATHMQANPEVVQPKGSSEWVAFGDSPVKAKPAEVASAGTAGGGGAGGEDTSNQESASRQALPEDLFSMSGPAIAQPLYGKPQSAAMPDYAVGSGSNPGIAGSFGRDLGTLASAQIQGSHPDMIATKVLGATPHNGQYHMQQHMLAQRPLGSQAAPHHQPQFAQRPGVPAQHQQWQHQQGPPHPVAVYPMSLQTQPMGHPAAMGLQQVPLAQWTGMQQPSAQPMQMQQQPGPAMNSQVGMQWPVANNFGAGDIAAAAPPAAGAGAPHNQERRYSSGNPFA